jgi:hypothetical protein
MTTFATVSGVPVTQLIEADRLEAISGAYPQGRRRNRCVAQDRLGVLRAGRLGRRHGRIGPEELGPHPALRRALDGQYGISGCYCGVPVKLNRSGIEKIIEMDLNTEESAALQLRPRPSRKTSKRSRRSNTERDHREAGLLKGPAPMGSRGFRIFPSPRHRPMRRAVWIIG